MPDLQDCRARNVMRVKAALCALGGLCGKKSRPLPPPEQ